MDNKTKIYVELGKDATKVLGEFYGEKLVKFIKDEPLADGETSGGMYLGEIKKYYDRYGYKPFNDALIYLYELKTKKENKDNE